MAHNLRPSFFFALVIKASSLVIELHRPFKIDAQMPPVQFHYIIIYWDTITFLLDKTAFKGTFLQKALTLPYCSPLCVHRVVYRYPVGACCLICRCELSNLDFSNDGPRSSNSVQIIQCYHVLSFSPCGLRLASYSRLKRRWDLGQLRIMVYRVT